MKAHLKKMTHHDNFMYLTVALTLLLLSTAIAQQFFDASIQRFVQSTTVITLLLAVWGVKSERILFTKAAIFPTAIILTSMIGNYTNAFGIEFTHLILMLFFFVFTAFQTLKQVIFSGKIDGNKILGAICLYLLLGLIWALLYTLAQLYFGNAFSGLGENEAWYILFPDFIYFSFVTLTTLGFGDISPTLPLTRFLVYFQAISGQFYLAIIIASLVGARMSTMAQEGEQNNN